jgi:predicted glutamine amidotransferase
MCRILGVVAARPAPLADLLSDELDPFLELACEHGDGWGVSYIGLSGRVVTVKEPVSARQSVTFKTLVKCAATTAAIIHLRLASEGLANTDANTHPFGDSTCGFAHNGQFVPVDAIDKALGPEPAVAGDTDSERYYLAVRRRMDMGFSPPAAITGAAAQIQELATQWVSLNCLLLTPTALYAYAKYRPGSEVLTRRGPDFFDLRYQADPGRVIVASTGFPQPADSWLRLPKGLVLEVGRDLKPALR